METPTMGKVIVQARIENVVDLFNASQGSLPTERVRSVEVGWAYDPSSGQYVCALIAGT